MTFSNLIYYINGIENKIIKENLSNLNFCNLSDKSRKLLEELTFSVLETERVMNDFELD